MFPRSTFHDKHKGLEQEQEQHQTHQQHQAIAASGDGQKVKNSFETPFVVLIFGDAS